MGPFRELWRVKLDGAAHMMLIHHGVVYTQWTSGILSAVDLHTGTILRQASGVAYATAPFIVDDRIYSYWVGALYELDLSTLGLRRVIPVRGGGYSEHLPYDTETKLWFVWRWEPEDRAFFSAIRLSDGEDAWRTGFSLGSGPANTGSPLLPGDDSVYVHAADGTNKVYRFDKATGALRWVTPLTAGSVVSFNNMIYDRAHDALYVATVDARCFALRRTDGGVLWSRDLEAGYEVRSSLAYHAGYIYLPLFAAQTNPGAYAALNCTNGVALWVQPGFFDEDGWSATAVDDRYLYRNTHNGEGKIIVQDRFSGELVWWGEAGAPQPCTNPVQSDGIVVFGNEIYLIAIRAGQGLPVDCPWHGVNGTGYNPGALIWSDPAPDPDVDRDGLPDTWEVDAFGHLFQGGEDDPDGDGGNNGEEYIAGTSATQAHDRLAFAHFISRNRIVIRLQTRTVAGPVFQGLKRIYVVESATSVHGASRLPLAGVPPISGDDTTVSVPLPPSRETRFYRVRAWLVAR